MSPVLFIHEHTFSECLNRETCTYQCASYGKAS